MTITEFMHPYKSATRKVQVQAALAYNKRQHGLADMSVAGIRDALVTSRVPGARRINVSQVLGDSAPCVHQTGPGTWAITETGERALGLLDAESPVSPATADLSGLAARIADDAARGYVDEAVVCLGAGARRAAVVFLWTGAVATLRGMVCGAATVRSIEGALQAHNPRARFSKQSDFENVKDSALLQVAHDLDVLDKSQKKRLGEALDLRNDCGHPVKYEPGAKKVESFIEDVVGIVWP
jgi:hypothetical protein